MPVKKEIAIVGAGVAGLATAKVFLSQGYAVREIRPLPSTSHARLHSALLAI